MGAYGVYELAQEIHLSHANTDLDLPAGRFEPADEDEAAALAHLTSVSIQHEGDEMSKPMAVLVEAPTTPDQAPPVGQPPPGQSPSEASPGAGPGPGQTPPLGPSVQGASAEAPAETPSSSSAPASGPGSPGDEPSGGGGPSA